MHDFYHQRLLADPGNFQPRDGNRYIEIVSHEEDDPVITEGQLQDSEIPDWISRTTIAGEGSTSILRLLIGAPEEHRSDAEMLPLPISRATYEMMCASWNLPTELLRMMLSTLPLTLSIDTVNETGKSVKGLMLRGARSRDWNFCLGLVFSPATRVACAIVNGMQRHEVDHLVHCLKLSSQHVCDPALLPIFLLELKVHFFAVLLEKRALGIEEIEFATGMRHGFSSDPRRNTLIDKERKFQAKGLDFNPITQKLTGLTGTLSFCDMTFSSSRRALGVIVKMRKDLCAVVGESGIMIGHWQATSALNMRIDYLDELIAGSQAHATVLSARTKAQVQTVYSMIGQRDNKLNIETATASREIAATSLVHNEAMKDIAEDSRKIAMLTRRDSLDMRIIAAVTLVFLPGTFMATMFGSGFFKFFPDGSTQKVSGWIWLYWVLTVGVTGVVLLVWWFFTKRQGQKLFPGSQEMDLRVASAESRGVESIGFADTESRRRSSLKY